MIAAATGHRPNKLGNEYEHRVEHYGPYSLSIYNFFMSIIENRGTTKGISGMALGVDMIWAQALIDSNIPLICAIPFKGQENRWPKHTQDYYNYLIRRAFAIHIVSEGGYTPWKMQIRNAWMVDRCDEVFAVWDGTEGGTLNCINYASSLNKPIYYFDRHLLPNKIKSV